MSEIKAIIGVCLDMCPQSEIKWREENGLLHEFEITKGSELMLINERSNKSGPIIRPKADKRKVVKQFSRSSAGQRMQTAEELRPIKVLVNCVDYLLSKVASIQSVPWNIVYDYIFDRLRCVRQDMSIQCSDDIQCVTILEQCVRFHIYSAYHFGDESIKLYDKHINDIHLRECLQSVLKRYDTQSTLNSTKFRPLFESIYLIYSLGTNDALLRYGKLPHKLQTHRLISRCYQIGVNFETGLYYQVIQAMMPIKPPILGLLASIKLPEVHAMAIRIMSCGYHSTVTHFPIRILIKWLCPFETNTDKNEKYVQKLCQTYGLVVNNDSVVFNKKAFNESAKPPLIQKWSSFEYFLSQLSVRSLLRGRHEYLYIEE